jgi:competence protein ComEA
MADLDALPGIGPVTAQKLLDYRTRQGRFVSVEELKDAKLVNASVFERIKDLVEVR